MSKPLLAFLDRDGASISVCTGCTKILHEQGMVEIAEQHPLPVKNAPDGTYCMIVYRIAPPFTLDECRDAIKGRHIGEAWGS